MKTFETWLEEFFIELDEVDGVPITKDNVEDLFDNWLSELDGEVYIRLVNLYGKEQALAGAKEPMEMLRKINAKT